MTSFTLDEVLDYLEKRRTRATYSAVGEVIGVYHRHVGKRLAVPSRRTAWVVTATTWKPGNDEFDADPSLVPPDLLGAPIILSGDVLRFLLLGR